MNLAGGEADALIDQLLAISVPVPTSSTGTARDSLPERYRSLPAPSRKPYTTEELADVAPIIFGAATAN